MIILIILLAVFMAVILPLLILLGAVAEYVLLGISLSRIAKQTDACKPAHAWIPVVQYRVLGRCAEACHQKTEKDGKKCWSWGKIMLITGGVYLGVTVFVMPIAMLLAIFGLGILVDAIAWLGVVFGVMTAVCSYKIYRYYMDDPSDVIVLVLTVLYPGWNSIALLITSFLKPRVKNVPEQQDSPEQDSPEQEDSPEQDSPEQELPRQELPRQQANETPAADAPQIELFEDDGAAVIAAEEQEG